MEEKTIIDRLRNIQTALNAPKNQRNHFGGYNYRSCEDILEAVKPLLKQEECALIIRDEIEMIGNRFYIKATAKLSDNYGNVVDATAYAREEESKKGMDSAQLTGATSSYARKYALNGLFCIDDNKDADATNTHGKDEPKASSKGKKAESTDYGAFDLANPHLKCADCGDAIYVVSDKDGKAIPLDEYEQKSQQYFGKVLCRGCQKKAMKK